jgi:hypothetical protein
VAVSRQGHTQSSSNEPCPSGHDDIHAAILLRRTDALPLCLLFAHPLESPRSSVSIQSAVGIPSERPGRREPFPGDFTRGGRVQKCGSESTKFPRDLPNFWFTRGEFVRRDPSWFSILPHFPRFSFLLPSCSHLVRHLLQEYYITDFTAAEWQWTARAEAGG